MIAPQRHARARRRVGLVVGFLLAGTTLIWAARDRPDAVALDRQRDDETLEQARVTPSNRRPSAPRAPATEPAAVPAADTNIPPAPPAPIGDTPARASARPVPPREIFQARPPPSPAAVDTGLVFGNRPPPEPAKNTGAGAPARAVTSGPRVPLADARPEPPAALFAPAHRRGDRDRDSGLVFSARPPTPPEGFVKRAH